MGVRRLSLAVPDWDGYATRWAAMHGGYDPRRASLPVRSWFAASYRGSRLLGGFGVPPAAATVLGLAACVAVPLIASRHGPWPAVAATLVVLAGVADSLDGGIAIVTGRVTRLGYVYGSIADRLGEACWLVALWALGAPPWLVIAAGATAWLHEYVRSRAIAAGMTGVGAVTLGERPMRALVAALGLALSGLGGQVTEELAAGASTLAVAVWLLLGLTGLAQLTTAVHDALG